MATPRPYYLSEKEMQERREDPAWQKFKKQTGKEGIRFLNGL